MWPPHTQDLKDESPEASGSPSLAHASTIRISRRSRAWPARCFSNSARSSRVITTAICRPPGSYSTLLVGLQRVPFKPRVRSSSAAAGLSRRARVDAIDATFMQLLSSRSTETGSSTSRGASMAKSIRRQTTGGKNLLKIRFPAPLSGSIGVRTDPLSGEHFPDCPAHRGSQVHYQRQTAPLSGDL